MSNYVIYIRRECNEVGFSVTDITTHELKYKNSFTCDLDYVNDPRFVDLRNTFLEYLKDEVDITFTNNRRTIKLLTNLIGKDKVLDYNDVDLYDPIYLKCSSSDIMNKNNGLGEYNRITIRGGKIYDNGFQF